MTERHQCNASLGLPSEQTWHVAGLQLCRECSQGHAAVLRLLLAHTNGVNVEAANLLVRPEDLLSSVFDMSVVHLQHTPTAQQLAAAAHQGSGGA